MAAHLKFSIASACSQMTLHHHARDVYSTEEPCVALGTKNIQQTSSTPSGLEPEMRSHRSLRPNTYNLSGGRRAAKTRPGDGVFQPEARVPTSNLRLQSEIIDPVLEALSLVFKITLHVYRLKPQNSLLDTRAIVWNL